MTAESTSLLARANKQFLVDLPNIWKFIVGQFAGLLGFLALPVTVGFIPGINGTFVFRGILTGIICGLGAAGFSGVWAASGAAVAAVIGALVLLAISPGLGAVWVLLSIAIAAVVAFGIAWVVRAGFAKAAVIVALLTLFLMVFWVGGFLGGPYQQALTPLHQKLSSEPVAEQYGFDGEIFLRTYYLMNSGMPFYEAFTKAYVDDSRLTNPPITKLGFRQPLLYWIWTTLPGNSGVALLFWFCILACGVMATGYLLAGRFVSDGVALLAPATLAGYFLWPTLGTWFTLSEFWAGAAGVFCVAALVRKKWLPGAVLLVVAVAIRELMIYLLPVFILAWIFHPQRRKAIPALVLAIVGPITALALHFKFAPQYGGVTTKFILSDWLHGGLSVLTNALKFSGDLVVGGPTVNVVLVILAALGALFVAPAWRKVLLFLTVLVPVISLTLFAMNEWQYYWGAIAMPLMLSMAPIAFAPLLPSQAVLADLPQPNRSGPQHKADHGKKNNHGKGKRNK